MYITAEVEVFCDICTKEIDDDSDIICLACAEEIKVEAKNDIKEILEKLEPYVNEATLLKPVEIPAELAVFLQYKVRSYLGV